MNYTKFTIRDKKPTVNDKYVKCYIRKEAGWSGAIIGSPTDSECNVLSNCVGYAQGRFCEIYNEITGYEGNKYEYLNCNAENFIERAQKSYPELVMGNEPRPGAIICWQKGETLSGSDGAGHVAVVEKIIDSETILTSESGWGNKNPFWTQTRKKGSDGNWGFNGKFRAFIYNPTVKEVPEEDNKPTETQPSVEESEEKNVEDNKSSKSLIVMILELIFGAISKLFNKSKD